jgi:hypothetical protein
MHKDNILYMYKYDDVFAIATLPYTQFKMHPNSQPNPTQPIR